MLNRAMHSAFSLVGRRAICDLRDTIVLAGAPRSGTTWFLELLRTLPGYKALNEPLMYEEARRQHGFGWRTWIAPGEKRPAERDYLHKVLTGQFDTVAAWHFDADTRAQRLLEHFRQRKLVVKFCRVGRMLQWLCKQFDVRGTVLLIRHPCAVVASMLRHGAWKEGRLHGKNRAQQALHDEEIPSVLRDRFAGTLERVDTQVEVLATMWCLDYYIPFHLHSEAGYPWMLMAYERLVTAGIQELERLAAVEVEVTPAMRAQFDVPSSSIRDSPRRKAHDQLSKWKQRLTTRQVDEVLRIVGDFELDFYTDDLHPDYDWLMQFQRDEAKANALSYAA
jgi:hypothetical protein